MEVVPELKGYDRFFSVKNPQNPAISPKNCGGYAEVEKAIDLFVRNSKK